MVLKQMCPEDQKKSKYKERDAYLGSSLKVDFWDRERIK